jgi:hypothetical protein
VTSDSLLRASMVVWGACVGQGKQNFSARKKNALPVGGKAGDERGQCGGYPFARRERGVVG